jgi:hypothetical protein
MLESRIRRGVSRPNGASGAEPQPQRCKRHKRACGVQQGIISRGCAAGDEGLVDFIQNGVARGNRERRNAPSPAPSFASRAHAAVEEQAKHKILAEVRALSNEVVDREELILCQGWDQPSQDRFDHRGRMFRGKRIRGHGENHASPQDCRPPGAQPTPLARRVQASLNFRQLRSRARIAPRLGIRH